MRALNSILAILIFSLVRNSLAYFLEGLLFRVYYSVGLCIVLLSRLAIDFGANFYVLGVGLLVELPPAVVTPDKVNSF